VNTWLASATPIDLGDLCGTSIAAYAVEDRFPVVALAGVRRPTLFVARQVLDTLSPDELRVAVAHEAAHRRAWDNVKRLWFCWSPDLLGCSPIGRWLEREWAAAAECAADRRAAAGSPRRGVALAGALVKVSRMAVAPSPGTSLFSTLHERGDIADRVSRLVAPGPARHPAFRKRLFAGTLLVGVAAGPWLSQSWAAIHAMTEACLRLLP
jgi:beta-lactamase regulating signal transducer with metallopeptidase domain